MGDACNGTHPAFFTLIIQQQTASSSLTLKCLNTGEENSSAFRLFRHKKRPDTGRFFHECVLFFYTFLRQDIYFVISSCGNNNNLHDAVFPNERVHHP